MRDESAPGGHHAAVRRHTLFHAALAACVLLASAAAASPPSGLHGVVRKGPTAPVCRAGQSCDAPARVTLVFSRSGRAAVTARSDEQGRYRVLLAPGYYSVTTRERIGIGHAVRPHDVHVRAGHVDRLDFSIDTGIR
jgi:hypothetical protein